MIVKYYDTVLKIWLRRLFVDGASAQDFIKKIENKSYITNIQLIETDKEKPHD